MHVAIAAQVIGAQCAGQLNTHSLDLMWVAHAPKLSAHVTAECRASGVLTHHQSRDPTALGLTSAGSP